jgi:hypothetical protein
MPAQSMPARSMPEQSILAQCRPLTLGRLRSWSALLVKATSKRGPGMSLTETQRCSDPRQTRLTGGCRCVEDGHACRARCWARRR